MFGTRFLPERFWGGLLFLWMTIIFGFSSIPGSVSSSAAPLWYILERKGAHVTEYCILAVLAALFFSTQIFLRKEKRMFHWIVLLFCIAYALSDEIHQIFVFGREGRFTDVLIDTGGSVLGVIFFLLWQQKKVRNRFRGISFIFKKKASR